MELTFVVVENELDYYVDLFLRFKRATRRPKTVKWYGDCLRYYLEITGHAWPPTPVDLCEFLETLQARGLAESSISSYYRAIKVFVNWAYKSRFIPENPLNWVDAPANPRPLPKAPPAAAIVRLLATIAGTGNERWENCRDYALFSLALDTGARIGELAAMQLAHVDLMYQQIEIPPSKNKRGRTLEIGDAAALDLSHWIVKRMELNIPHSMRALWISRYRGRFRPFTHWGMRQALRDWQARAGVEHFTFHGFRHAYAVYSLRNKADLLDIRDQMGHASIQTTAIYTQVANEGRKERHRQTSPRSNLLM